MIVFVFKLLATFLVIFLLYWGAVEFLWEDDWRIDILDEWFCQPYDYQYLLERYSNDINTRVLAIVKKNVDEIMDSFVHKGIISGWEVGDYV